MSSKTGLKGDLNSKGEVCKGERDVLFKDVLFLESFVNRTLSSFKYFSRLSSSKELTVRAMTLIGVTSLL